MSSFRDSGKDSQITETPVPFLPPQIGLDDVSEHKGKLLLLPENIVAEIIRRLATAKPNVRYKDDDPIFHGLLLIGLDVVKDKNGDCHVVYYGEQNYLKGNKLIGKGNYGAVKWTQNIGPSNKKGEFNVYKIQTANQDTSIDDLRVMSKDEIYALKKAGVLQAAFERFSTKKGQQINFIMQAAPGIPLDKYANDLSRKKSTRANLNIALDMFKAIQALHAQRLIHRDIKIENFMYDPSTEKLTLIDLGFALNVERKRPDSEGLFRDAYRCGTEKTMAPECLVSRYGEKSDVFAVGASIAELLDLGRDPGNGPIELYTETSREFLNNQKIPDLDMRKEIRKFIEKCMDPNPKNRPSSAVAIMFFQSIGERYISLKDTKPLLIGTLNLNEYHSASPAEKNTMLTDLKTVDRIVLINTVNNPVPPKDIVVLKRQLESEGIVVDGNIRVGTKKENLVTAVHQDIERKIPRAQCVHISSATALAADLAIKEATLKAVLDGLASEKTRLQEKYKSKNAIADLRIKSIENAIRDINAYYKHEKHDLAFDKVRARLDMVENEMYGTSLLARAVAKFGYRSESMGSKNIARIKEDLPSESNPKPKH